MTWLACVAAGTWQVAGIKAAQEAGLRVLAIDGTDDAAGLEIADETILVDIRDPAAVVAAVAATGITIEGATTFTAEVGMVAAAAVRERWNLPGPGLGTTERLTHKAVQRRCLDQDGALNPTWARVDSGDQALEASTTIGFPLVVKPCDSAGSRGVSRADQPSHIPEAFIAAAAFGSRSEAIVEAWMPGVEHTVELLGDGSHWHVLAVTRKRRSSAAMLVADELVALPPGTPGREGIAYAASRALGLLGLRVGLAHVEVMWDEDAETARIVEVGGRGGGFHVAESLVPAVSGVAALRLSAELAVGRRVAVPRPAGLAGCLRFLPIKRGVFLGLDGLDALDAEGIVAGELATRGRLYADPTSDGDRAAYVLSVKPDASAATAAVDAAICLLELRFAPTDRSTND